MAFDYDRRTLRAKTARVLMTPKDGEQLAWPRVNENVWDEEAVQADKFHDVHVMRYIAFGVTALPKVTIDTTPWFHSNRPEFGFTIEVFARKVDTGKFKPGDYEREIPKLLDRALQLAEREAATHAKKLEQLKVSDWEIHYDKRGDELVVSYEAPGRSEYSDSSLSGSFYSPLDIFTGGKADYSVSYSAGSDYEGRFGGRDLKGEVRSVEDIKKVLKDAEALWKRAEARSR